MKYAWTVVLALSISSCNTLAQSVSPETSSTKEATTARVWTDALLFAIRRDLARPTVHARNLHHLSVAMFDAWALFDTQAQPVFMQRSNNPACEFSATERDALVSAETTPTEIIAAQEIALGHAAWNLLKHRFDDARNSIQILEHFAQTAQSQALDVANEQSQNNHPASVGLRVANCVIAIGNSDQSNEANDYANINYEPINPPLNPAQSGNPGMVDPNRWQPLQLDIFIDQSGMATDTPGFLGADWGQLEPFALTDEAKSSLNIDGVSVPTWLDPGAPPYLSDNPSTNQTYAMGNALVVMWSAQLDPADATMIDISPGAIGNLGPLNALGETHAQMLMEYDGLNGGLGRATGHALNPTTGQPYPPNLVRLGDYTRVLAEFWADGPDSETPPGHWFTVYNEAVVSHPAHQTTLEGVGEPIDPLKYDLLAYLALGGAMHDSAVAAWSVKRAYDYVRPVSAIRYMASLGQSTDTSAENYHVHGIPLVNGFIETIQPGDPLAGNNNEFVGRIKARAWRGPDYIGNPRNDVAGVDWIFLDAWWPYQRPTFVTPPFAGYVSGHSTFSRAAAEVLTQLTGDQFFPGGFAEFIAEQDDFLVFEKGPSTDVRLQWATYRDAADQTSLSRIWGGIHPPADDIAGRRMGEQIGIQAWQRTMQLANGTDNFNALTNENNNTGSSGFGCSVIPAQNHWQNKMQSHLHSKQQANLRKQDPSLLLLCLMAVGIIVRRQTR